MTAIIEADVVDWLRGREWLFQAGYLPRYHAVFCDPPYALNFMGKDFDKFDTPQHFQTWVTEWARLLLSAVYPGAVGLFFGGTRTYHRLATGLEDAGWLVEDCVIYLYGSGFPKSLDISKAIDREAGASREVVGIHPYKARKPNGASGIAAVGLGDNPTLTAPATEDAKRFAGFKTHLKPAYEPCILARAPRTGYTFAQLAQTFGTGALAIDKSRISHDEPLKLTERKFTSGQQSREINDGRDIEQWERSHSGEGMLLPASANTLGRYPANVILGCGCAGEHEAECPVRLLDEQSGDTGAHGGLGEFKQHNWMDGRTTSQNIEKDSGGGASRFLYTAKAAAWQREAGLDAFEEKETNVTRVNSDGGIEWRMENGVATNPKAPAPARKNSHPTVKPLDLCRYLARLICPPPLSEPRRLLVPFAGSGSEMIGAQLAGWDDITGIEREHEYAEIAKARLAWWARFTNIEAAKAAYDSEHERAETAQKLADEYGLRQLGLFGDAA